MKLLEGMEACFVCGRTPRMGEMMMTYGSMTSTKLHYCCYESEDCQDRAHVLWKITNNPKRIKGWEK